MDNIEQNIPGFSEDPMNEIIQGLLDLAKKGASSGGMSRESLLCQSAAHFLISQTALIRKLESDAEQRVERITHALERIAIAIQQAALHGWGNVRAGDLGDG